MYDQKIRRELLAQLNLSRCLYEGLLGWAKVIEVSDQDAPIYFPTTMEILDKVIDLVADFPDRLQLTIAEIEKTKADKQKTVVTLLKQYYTELVTLKSQTSKLASIGKQTTEDEKGVFLSKTAQEMYKMAAAMETASDNLRKIVSTVTSLSFDSSELDTDEYP